MNLKKIRCAALWAYLLFWLGALLYFFFAVKNYKEKIDRLHTFVSPAPFGGRIIGQTTVIKNEIGLCETRLVRYDRVDHIIIENYYGTIKCTAYVVLTNSTEPSKLLKVPLHGEPKIIMDVPEEKTMWLQFQQTAPDWSLPPEIHAHLRRMDVEVITNTYSFNPIR
jgi:hypothetical protein